MEEEYTRTSQGKPKFNFHSTSEGFISFLQEKGTCYDFVYSMQ